MMWCSDNGRWGAYANNFRCVVLLPVQSDRRPSTVFLVEMSVSTGQQHISAVIKSNDEASAGAAASFAQRFKAVLQPLLED